MAEHESTLEWYTAQLVFKLHVDGEEENEVHKNLILIHAASAQNAYDKALNFGKTGETHYENPIGQIIHIEFVGIAELEETGSFEICDGVEVRFERFVNMGWNDIMNMIVEKKGLRAFLPHKASGKSAMDLRSKRVLELEKRFKMTGSEDID